MAGRSKEEVTKHAKQTKLHTNVFISWGDAQIVAGNHPARMWLPEGLQWGGIVSSQSDICSSPSTKPKKASPKFLVPSYQVDQLGDELGGRSLKH